MKAKHRFFPIGIFLITLIGLVQVNVARADSIVDEHSVVTVERDQIRASFDQLKKNSGLITSSNRAPRKRRKVSFRQNKKNDTKVVQDCPTAVRLPFGYGEVSQRAPVFYVKDGDGGWTLSSRPVGAYYGRVGDPSCFPMWRKRAGVKAAPGKHSRSSVVSSESLLSAIEERGQAQARGAGLVIQPDGRHIPTMDAYVSTTNTTQHLTITLPSGPIDVDLRAVRYVADLGDGGVLLEQNTQPLPYPQGESGGMHRKFTHEGTFVPSLTTYWEVTWRDARGESHVLDQPLVTTEKTKPQLVKAYEYLITDDAEERNGH